MAQYHIKQSEHDKRGYDIGKVEALRVLRSAANEWAKGNPEEPPTDEVLEVMLDAFAPQFLLRRPKKS